MPGLFVKHDVDWWDQPAIVQAGELAAVLLQRMECHAQKHLTDGRVPATMIWHWRLPRTQARLDAPMNDPACPTCGGSSMPDGSPVDRCPDCTGVRA